MISNDVPDPGPLQPDAVHVVVGDLHDLLQAEHARVVWGRQLIHGHGAQPAHKVNCTGGACCEPRCPRARGPPTPHTYLWHSRPAWWSPWISYNKERSWGFSCIHKSPLQLRVQQKVSTSEGTPQSSMHELCTPLYPCSLAAVHAPALSLSILSSCTQSQSTLLLPHCRNRHRLTSLPRPSYAGTLIWVTAW